MKKLPIGIQTFEKIRNKSENYVYIDKTKIAFELIENGTYYFLSRPRRFGKSLFLDTLRTIFAGEKELFEGLYIYDKYDFKPYPIIYISFGGGVIQNRDELNEKFEEVLQNSEANLDIECHNKIYNRRCFSDLIKNSYEKYNQKVVILIDEYDKPILDNIENSEIAKEIRDGLKNFYSIIKDSDKYIKFAFLTGVSKFSKVSLFSGLNNIEDITLNPNYSTICGYTESDIEREFREHLKDVDLEEVKKWYNGYNWLGESVYNPFDILLFISNSYTFRSYWFETGSPSFLIKLIKERNYYIPKIENIKMSDMLLDSFDIDVIELETILFQTGYLTIDRVQKLPMGDSMYHLTYPNYEVKKSLTNRILAYLTNVIAINEENKLNLYEVLVENELNKLKDIFYSFFASIPNEWYRKNSIANYEGYYASIFYCYFSALGLDITLEDSTNLGRIDLTLKFDGRIYIFEFKVIEIDGKGKALKQIKDKKYYEKYLSYKEVYLIGIEFSKDEKNIKTYEWERVEQ